MACVAALLPASASAGGTPTESLGTAHELEYVRTVFPEVTSQIGSAAACPPSTPATGGGGSITGKSKNARLHESFPISADGDGWKVEGSTTNANSPRSVATYAICGPEAVTFEESPSTPDGGTVTHSAVLCDASNDPISGGVSATGVGLSFPTTRPQLPPSTAAWFTTYENTSTEDTVTAAFAGCTDGYDVRYRSGSDKGVRPGETGKAVATCKRSESVLGGGLSPTIPTDFGPLGVLDAWTLTTKPWDSDDRRKVPDDGWLARSYNDSTAKFKLTAFAVCKH